MRTVNNTIRFVGSLLAVVVVAELGLHAVENQLAEPLDWYAAQPQQLIDEMEQLEALGLRSDIVFVGSSMVGQGIDVAAIERGLASASRVHNVALDSAQPTVVQRWLAEEVVPRTQPSRVIWGVSSWEFNPNVPEPTIENYEMSRAIRSGFFGAADRLLANVSMLSRYRSLLRLDHGIRDLVGTPVPLEDSPNDAQALELLSRVQVEGDNRTPEELARIKANALLSWQLGESELTAFLDTVTEVRGSGIETVIVLMPIPSEYVEAHPGGRAEFESFRAEMLAIGREHGFVVLDFSRSYADASFKDYTHLRPEIAEQFSAELVSTLAEIGW